MNRIFVAGRATLAAYSDFCNREPAREKERGRIAISILELRTIFTEQMLTQLTENCWRSIDLSPLPVANDDKAF